MIYAKASFAGPEAVLAYLSRYTHRVTISNRRLIAFDESGVTFRCKDFCRRVADRQQVNTLATDEFIRRFPLHVLPRGFHHIRDYGLLASGSRKASIALARELLDVVRHPMTTLRRTGRLPPVVPLLWQTHNVIETFERWRQPRGPPDETATNRETAP